MNHSILVRSATLVVLLLLVVASIGCEARDKSGAAGSSETSTSAADSGAPREDHAKTVVASGNLPANPRRIVSLAPNITEILFALGLGDRVVAVTNYCDFPPNVKTLPKVGGFIDPDIERIMSHKPDLIVGVTSAGNIELPDKLTEAGLSYVFLEVENIEQTRDAILFLGATTGAIIPAAELNANIDDQLAAWEGEIEDPPSVLVVYGYEPLVAAGPNSFAHELVARAGATNVVESGERYVNLDAERLMALNPDIIIDAAMGGERGEVGEGPWSAYPGVTAVANGDVVKITDPAVMRPGPRMVKGFAEVSGAIQVVAKRGKNAGNR
jgi:iron complex transport system substrate-binding protein